MPTVYLISNAILRWPRRRRAQISPYNVRSRQCSSTCKPGPQQIKRQLVRCRGTHVFDAAQEMEWSHLLGP